MNATGPELDFTATGDRDPAIEVEGLSKQYRRPRQRWRRLLLPWSRVDSTEDDDEDVDEEEEEEEREEEDVVGRGPLWALRDVSFTASPGEVVCVIGPPGSGKSTLLRTLAGLTMPTEGRAVLRGRVGPTPAMARTLFAGQWKARKNVLALARFMDVPRASARQRMDEIISFAEVESHRELQMRHYPSEMEARLAFSAVLHFDPDILLADGYIGAGDRRYRHRCLELVLDATKERDMTVMLVTTDLRLTEGIADRVVWLEAGRVSEQGPADKVVPRYRSTHVQKQPSAPSDELVALSSAVLLDGSGRPVTELGADEDASFVIGFEVRTPRTLVDFSLNLQSSRSARRRADQRWRVETEGEYRAHCRVPASMLMDVRYSGTLALRASAFDGRRAMLRETVAFGVDAASQDTPGLAEGVSFDQATEWWLEPVDDEHP